MPADEGCCNDSQRKEADVDKKEGGWGDLRLDLDIKVAAGSGPGQEDKQVRSPLPITSISPKQELGGMQTLSQLLPFELAPSGSQYGDNI